MNISEYLQNPRHMLIKNHLITIMEGKYGQYDDLISRINHALVTENDMKMFAKFIGEIYEIAYMRAVKDHEEQLNQLGIKVSIKTKNLAESQKSNR